jgi:hypothetical protein
MAKGGGGTSQKDTKRPGMRTAKYAKIGEEGRWRTEDQKQTRGAEGRLQIAQEQGSRDREIKWRSREGRGVREGIRGWGPGTE